MPAVKRHAGHLAAVARVRAAIAAAGEARCEALDGYRLLVRRAVGHSLREIARDEGVTPQCIQYRERQALRKLAAS